MDYRAPRWLPGGHLQTIYPATMIAKPAVAMRRERWPTPDGDFIDIDFLDGAPGKPLVCCSTASKARPTATMRAS